MTMKDFLDAQATVEAGCYLNNSRIKGTDPANLLNYVSVADFVLDRGEPPAVSEPLTEEQYEYLMQVVENSVESEFPYKQCFYNSQVLLLADFQDRLVYCEGYCQAKTIPVHHGWLELDGKVVDVTFTAKAKHTEPQRKDLKDRVLGEIPNGWEYLGIRFDRDDIRSFVREHERVAAMIGNFRQLEATFMLPRITPRDFGAWEKLQNKVSAQ